MRSVNWLCTTGMRIGVRTTVIKPTSTGQRESPSHLLGELLKIRIEIEIELHIRTSCQIYVFY